MKVRELMSKLSMFNPDLEVQVLESVNTPAKLRWTSQIELVGYPHNDSYIIRLYPKF